MTGISTDTIDLFKNDYFLLGDFIDFFCGDWIGSGCSRVVYEFRMDPKLVVKIDTTAQFHNVSEWDIWHNIEDKEAKKLLAPCVHLSSCGRVMLQYRTKPITEEKFPKELPSFFTDIKLSNWGLLNGKPVCHDYANHKFFTGKQKITKSKLIY